MGYVRFVIQKNDCDSGRRQGLFQALSELERHGELRPEEQRTYDETYAWFRKHLRKPSSFARSLKPHAKRVAVSWFKDTATEYIRRLRALADILHAHGVQTEMLSTDRPGYVVYEDMHQVAAEPFKDTGA
jgi:hypothetical protein